MKSRVHPIVAVLIILLVLGVVAFLYTKVFTGQVEGIVGPPSNVSTPPAPSNPNEGPMKPRPKGDSKPATSDHSQAAPSHSSHR